MRRAAVALSVAVLAALAAGCADSDSGTTAASVSATTTTAGVVSTPAAHSRSSVPNAAGTNAPPECGPGGIEIAARSLAPGMNHRGVQLTFTLADNTPPCVLSGYPGVDTTEGGPVLHAERTPRGYMGGLPQGNDTPPTVTVLPGRPVKAMVEGSAMNPSGEDCPTYTGLAVTAPNSTDTRTVHTTINTCALQVHPVTG
ncbi:MAG: DUF4232 domain-containing protein [Nocardia sp.]|nr:DUF4232 domain-containing protein [Nocardia sp.]